MKPAALTLPLAIALAFAGCNADRNAAPEDAGDAAADTAAAGQPLPESLPQGFSLGFPYHFAKREVVDANGRKRLRYTVEYLDGDPRTVAASLGKSATAAGFDRVRSKRLPDGRIHFIAAKPGYGELRAEIQTIGDRKLTHASAKGTVVMGWPAR